MEFLDIVDENGDPTGEVAERGDAEDDETVKISYFLIEKNLNS